MYYLTINGGPFNGTKITTDTYDKIMNLAEKFFHSDADIWLSSDEKPIAVEYRDIWN